MTREGGERRWGPSGVPWGLLRRVLAPSDSQGGRGGSQSTWRGDPGCGLGWGCPAPKGRPSCDLHPLGSRRPDSNQIFSQRRGAGVECSLHRSAFRSSGRWSGAVCPGPDPQAGAWLHRAAWGPGLRPPQHGNLGNRRAQGGYRGRPLERPRISWGCGSGPCGLFLGLGVGRLAWVSSAAGTRACRGTRAVPGPHHCQVWS